MWSLKVIELFGIILAAGFVLVAEVYQLCKLILVPLKIVRHLPQDMDGDVKISSTQNVWRREHVDSFGSNNEGEPRKCANQKSTDPREGSKTF